MPVTETTTFEIHSRGEVPEGMTETARERVAHILDRFAHWPVLAAAIRIERVPNPATERPVIAKARVDVNGRPVVAHVAAERFDEALDLLCERLRHQLEHLSDRREARYRDTGVAEPGAWRHGALPTRRPDWFDRPTDERRIVRNKTPDPTPATVDEALFDMQMAEADFWLFVDAGSGQDTLVSRSEGEAEVHSVDGADPEVAAAGTEIAVSTAPAPTLSVDEARERLEATGERFVFFRDAETGRGTVLYHRYDGHYGLLAPSGTSEA